MTAPAARVRPLRVLVVDDSAVARKLLSAVCVQEGMEVCAASDPLIALERMRVWPPDVIVLDLEMPRMDGLTFLRVLRRDNRTPVVICSGVAGERGHLAIRALEQGATEVVARPRVGLREYFQESRLVLTDAIRAAAQARPRSRSPEAPAPVRPTRPGAWCTTRQAHGVVAVGASTGGTDALHDLLAALPASSPAIVIAQHMPAGFTRALAARLDAVAAIRVKEAKSGDLVEPGVALLAPGGSHLRVRRGPEGLRAEVDVGPLVRRHRPSVDVLFESVAEAAGPRALGALLTGMGEDGCEGMRALRRAGAATLAQDEASCVVFGMPKAAIDAGVVDEVVPLRGMAAAIMRRVSAGGSARGA